MIFFTSDLHFRHNKEFIYGPRGFDNIDDHDRTIIENWNSVVRPCDTVYVLGDVMLKDNEGGKLCWDQLKGQKKIILGNHDSNPRIDVLRTCHDTKILGYATMVRIKGRCYYLSHYPTMTGNFAIDRERGKIVYNLCGHSHTKDRFLDLDKGPIYHVEVDCHNMTPVSIDEIIRDIDREMK